MKSIHDFKSVDQYKEYLRTYFAAMAMQSMVAGEGARMVADRDGRYDETNWKKVVAWNAIEIADELLKQLEDGKH